MSDIATLFEVLEEKGSLGRQFAYRLRTDVRPLVEQLMPGSIRLFPSYAPHLVQHLDAVAANLEWLLQDDLKNALNAYELYFLIAAAYVHDVGMVDSCPGPPEGEIYESFLVNARRENPDVAQVDLVANYVRRMHHLRSEAFVSTNGARLGLGSNAQEWALIGRIAAGHRVENLGDAARYGAVYLGSNVPIHRDLLAAYLRLADELDLTTYRTPALAFEGVNPADDVAIDHWRRHLSVLGVGKSGYDIVVNGRCTDYDTHLFLLDLQQKVQEQLDELRSSLRNPYRLLDGRIIPDPFPYRWVRFEIESVGYKAWHIRFEVDAQRISELLSSQVFYSDQTVAIRELLQNSVDACRLRQRIAQRSPTYSPTVTVTETRDQQRRRIVVADNGVGMSAQTVQRHLGQVGRSFYRSRDFTAMATDFEPIGYFGIGLLSTFMISERLTIWTRSDGGESLQIEIRDRARHFKVTPYDRTTIGTEVTLSVRPEFTKPLGPIVRRYAVGLEFPITVTTPDGEEVVEANSDLRVEWRRPLLDRFRRQKKDDPTGYDGRRVRQDFTGYGTRRDFEDVAISLSIVTPRLRDSTDLPWLDLTGDGRYDLKLSNQGILIADSKEFAMRYTNWVNSDDDYFGFGIFGIVNFRKHPKVLVATRDDLIDSPWLQDVQRRVRLCVLDAVRKSADLVDKRRDVDVAAKRAYLFNLLVHSMHSGIMTRHWGARNQDNYCPTDVHQMRFSLDDDLPESIYEPYAMHYPLAVKVGTSAVFLTLSDILRRRDLKGINCCLADKFYPNFNAWLDLERDGQITIVLDEAREFELIRRFLERRNYPIPTRFWTGWQLCLAAGARVESTVASNIKQLLPVRSALVEAPWMTNDVSIRSTDTQLTHSRDAIGGIHTSSRATDVLYMFNVHSPLGQWLKGHTFTREEAALVNRFLLFLVGNSQSFFWVEGDREAKFDQFVKELGQLGTVPPLGWKAMELGVQVDFSHQTVQGMAAGVLQQIVRRSLDDLFRSARGWPQFAPFTQGQWWEDLADPAALSLGPEI